MKNCTPLWREAHFQVKMYKTPQRRTTFGSCDVEKVHALVARGTFASRNVQNTWVSEHFWKLGCRKSARRCGAKHIPSQYVQNTSVSDHFWKLRCRKSARPCGVRHISKSKCTKHTTFGPLLEVAMSKKCTPLWREAHFQVKMYKAHHIRTTFGSCDVEKVHAVVARSTFPSQNVQSTPHSDHFWKLRCRTSARPCGAKRISKWTCPKHTSSGPLLEVKMSKKCTPLWREAHVQVKMLKAPRSDDFWRVRCPFASLRYTTLHYTTLHYTPLHYTTLHYTTLHSTQLQLQLHNYTTTQLHNYTTTQLHNYTTTQLHNYTTTLHYTPLH